MILLQVVFWPIYFFREDSAISSSLSLSFLLITIMNLFCKSILLEKPGWFGLAGVGTGWLCWNHPSLVTGSAMLWVTDLLLEWSPDRPIEVKGVSLCTEVKDEGRHKAVICKCIQACLGLLHQLVSFPKKRCRKKQSKYSIAGFQHCCNLSFPALASPVGLQEGFVSCIDWNHVSCTFLECGLGTGVISVCLCSNLIKAQAVQEQQGWQAGLLQLPCRCTAWYDHLLSS